MLFVLTSFSSHFQERLIANILKKPFRVPIPGYEGRKARSRFLRLHLYLALLINPDA